MALEDFKECAEHSLGQQVHDWDELVVQNLVQVAHWYQSQNESIRYIFEYVARNWPGRLLTWLAELVEAAAAEVVAAVLASFAVGVGIGSGLVVVIDCANHL
jgi:hypothetical protein